MSWKNMKDAALDAALYATTFMLAVLLAQMIF